MANFVKTGTMSTAMQRRVWIQIVALLMLAFQGWHDFALLCPYLPTATPATTANLSISDEALHGAVCHCRNCQGGKKCCCLKAPSKAEGSAFRAICDAPEEAILSGVIPPRALPTASVPLMVDWVSTTSCAPVIASSAFRPGRRPEPSDLPPRSLTPLTA
jgi:hypothetical protein